MSPSQFPHVAMRNMRWIDANYDASEARLKRPWVRSNAMGLRGDFYTDIECYVLLDDPTHNRLVQTTRLSDRNGATSGRPLWARGRQYRMDFNHV
jgi:hypothetical protein